MFKSKIILFKYILIIILSLLLCGTAKAQDINIYNSVGYNRDYAYRSGYSLSQPRSFPVRPAYSLGYYNLSPSNLYSMYRAMGREQRRQEHIAIWSVKRVEIIEARYRNYKRISNRTGYDPGGPTKLDSYYER